MSNSILKDMATIVCAAAPELRVYGIIGPGKNDSGYLLWRKLWDAIKPVKFGNSVSWTDATELVLARNQVPRDMSRVVLRVKTQTINYTAAAGDLSVVSAAPPGSAWWQYESLGSSVAQIITDPDAPVQTMTNCEEFLIFKGGYYITLNLNLSSAPPNAQTREVRTLVYSYNINAEIADRIGANQAEMIIP